MHRLAFLLLLFVVPVTAQQQQQQQQRPFPEEVAFSKLAPELQRLLANVSPAEALYKVELARQNLIALGQPNPSPEQLYATLRTLLVPNYGSVQSASAGATSFPPLSPLAAPPPPPLAR